MYCAIIFRFQWDSGTPDLTVIFQVKLRISLFIVYFIFCYSILFLAVNWRLHYLMSDEFNAVFDRICRNNIWWKCCNSFWHRCSNFNCITIVMQHTVYEVWSTSNEKTDKKALCCNAFTPSQEQFWSFSSVNSFIVIMTALARPQSDSLKYLDSWKSNRARSEQ